MARSMVVILCPHPEDEVRECDAENCHAAKERIGDPLRVLFGLRFIFRKRHPFPNDLPVPASSGDSYVDVTKEFRSPALGRREPTAPFHQYGRALLRFANDTRVKGRAGESDIRRWPPVLHHPFVRAGDAQRTHLRSLLSCNQR